MPNLSVYAGGIIASVALTAAIAQGAANGFVTRNGKDFMLNGAPFRFVGANMYNAAGDPTIYECGPWMGNPDTELDDWFYRAQRDFGATVIRFWAYQSYTKSGTRWDAFDRVMATANKYGLKVIPVLENQWTECSDGNYKYDTWYAGGYLSPYSGQYNSYSLSYKDYVRQVVTRYANEPAIFAWMLMNEAESQNTLNVENSDALYTFAQDMTAYVKSLDPNHMVTLGTIGGAQPGVQGSNYEHLLSLSSIDFAEYHDYDGDDEALPGLVSPPVAELYTGIYTQDAVWTWWGQPFTQNQARQWQEWTTTVPAGQTPFHRVGLNIYGNFVGDIYVDRIELGSHIYDFEDGTREGWDVSGAASVVNSSQYAYSGNDALKVFHSTSTQGLQLWLDVPADVVPGTTVRFHVYVDTDGVWYEQSSLAAAVAKSAQLGKPLLVGEAGMWVCTPDPNWQLETVDSRAQKFDAKLNAFFGRGGNGYLIWSWDPTSDCKLDFTTGDPLNNVLLKYPPAAGSGGNPPASPRMLRLR